MKVVHRVMCNQFRRIACGGQPPPNLWDLPGEMRPTALVKFTNSIRRDGNCLRIVAYRLHVRTATTANKLEALGFGRKDRVEDVGKFHRVNYAETIKTINM